MQGAPGPLQGMPWFAGTPPTHAPATHVSPERHVLMVVQLVPSGNAAGTQLIADSEHTFIWHAVVLGVHVMEVPVHVPFLHVSLTVQKSPSSHVAPLFAAVFWQPNIGSHNP
jgi:hypothetical protein